MIRHHVNTITLPLVELVESFIATTIGVILNTEAVDLLIEPITRELTSIGPPVSAKALNDVILVVARI